MENLDVSKGDGLEILTKFIDELHRNGKGPVAEMLAQRLHVATVVMMLAADGEPLKRALALAEATTFMKSMAEDIEKRAGVDSRQILDAAVELHSRVQAKQAVLKAQMKNG